MKDFGLLITFQHLSILEIERVLGWDIFQVKNIQEK